MKIVIARNVQMKYQAKIGPRRGDVRGSEFLVRCKPQCQSLNDSLDQVTASTAKRIEQMSGNIKLFLGRSGYYNDSDEGYCGAWIRDMGTFLKRIFITLEQDNAVLRINVKHLGRNITKHDFSMKLICDISKPRTAVKVRSFVSNHSLATVADLKNYWEVFEHLRDNNFTVTLTLEFTAC